MGNLSSKVLANKSCSTDLNFSSEFLEYGFRVGLKIII